MRWPHPKSETVLVSCSQVSTLTFWSLVSQMPRKPRRCKSSAYVCLQMLAWSYARLRKVTQGYARLRKVTQGYARLRKVTQGYARLRKVTQGYARLRKVTQGNHIQCGPEAGDKVLGLKWKTSDDLLSITVLGECDRPPVWTRRALLKRACLRIPKYVCKWISPISLKICR